jgi:hypothetical protein
MRKLAPDLSFLLLRKSAAPHLLKYPADLRWGTSLSRLPVLFYDPLAVKRCNNRFRRDLLTQYMKKTYLILFFAFLLTLGIPNHLFAQGTTYVWNQTGTAPWTTSTNWTPTRTTPATNDILQFSGGNTIGLTTVGSTNYPTAKVMTPQGGASISTTQSKFGGASGSFTETYLQYLSTPDSPDWYFGTGDFTIDMWVRFTSLPSSPRYVVLVNQYVDGTHHWEYYLYNNGGTYEWHFENCNGVSPEFTVYLSRTTSSLSINTWYHIAIVRNVNTWYLFQNGVSLTGIPPSPPNLPQLTNGAVSDFTIDLSIGGHFPPGDYLNGYLDEIRISKGVARWTSAFTPPTARYDRDASTVLLLHNDVSGFLDDVTTGQAKATKATLPINAPFTSMSFYSHAAGNVRLSIYNDASGAPGTKQWESNDVAVTASAWTTVNISSGNPTSLTLNSGTYWLAWQWNPGSAYAAGPSYTAGSPGDGNYLYQSYAAFPSSWSGGTSSSERWSIYALYTKESENVTITNVPIQTIAQLLLSNSTTVNLRAASAGNTLTVNDVLTTTSGDVLNLGSGLVLGGTLTTLNNSGKIQTAVPTATSSAPIPAGKTWGGTVEYNGLGGAQTAVGGTYYNFILNNAAGAVLGNSGTVTGTLTLTSGRLTLGTNNITLGSVAVAGTLNASNMIVATGTGECRRTYTANGSYTFPVGDATGTAEYSPITLNFTSGSYLNAYAGVRVINAKHPNNASAINYLNRYWKVTSSGITSFSCNVTGTYVTADIAGTENLQKTGEYIGSLPWIKYSPLGSNTLTANGVTVLGDFTGIDATPPTVTISANPSLTVCQNASLTLTANPVGDPPFTYSWNTIPVQTTPSINPSTATPGSTTYTVTVTDGNGFTASATSTVVVNALPTCSITGPAVLCPFSTGNTYTGPAGMTKYAWSISGNGSIVPPATVQSVTVTAGSNNSTFTLSLTVTDGNGCTSTCTTTVDMLDNQPPNFIPPTLATGYCVEGFLQAIYNPGGKYYENDLTPARRDYYILTAENTLLDLTNITDNCPGTITIAWTIDFGNDATIDLSGTGQISLATPFNFPLGDNLITWVVTDANGNSAIATRILKVVPRPGIY